MGFFDQFKPQPPQKVAPHVTERPPMTEYNGKIINAAAVVWTVHQYILDTVSSRLVYDKYHKCETEAAAKALCNSLKCQHLPGGHKNLCDYWGEFAEKTFQEGLQEARDKAREDFQHQLAILRQKKISELDAVQKRFYSLKQDYEQAKSQLDKMQEEHKQEIDSIMQSMQEEIDRQTAEHVNAANARWHKKAIDAGRAVLAVLAEPEKNRGRCRRLAAKDKQFAQLQGPDEYKLIAYHLAKLLQD